MIAVAQRHRLVGGDAVRVDRRHRTRPAAGLGAPPRERRHRRPGAGRAAAAGQHRRGVLLRLRRLDRAEAADLAVRGSASAWPAR
ncbi:MAG: hypothetical protein MZW92_43205 [Comamonadaceae bacterium]|nr:hypothetical protein [Comamonadaceae bacterium]